LDAGVPGIPQELTHPAAGIGFSEAVAFCEWLTQRERRSGKLKSWQRYRLPTDEEWSRFAGLSESGETPEERGELSGTNFPWGGEWPAATRIANYAEGSSPLAPYIVESYNDGFPYTSPAGSFPASKTGLFHLSGNVWEWVSDSFSGTNPGVRVLRGG